MGSAGWPASCASSTAMRRASDCGSWPGSGSGGRTATNASAGHPPVRIAPATQDRTSRRLRWATTPAATAANGHSISAMNPDTRTILLSADLGVTRGFGRRGSRVAGVTSHLPAMWCAQIRLVWRPGNLYTFVWRASVPASPRFVDESGGSEQCDLANDHPDHAKLTCDPRCDSGDDDAENPRRQVRQRPTAPVGCHVQSVPLLGWAGKGDRAAVLVSSIEPNEGAVTGC